MNSYMFLKKNKNKTIELDKAFPIKEKHILKRKKCKW